LLSRGLEMAGNGLRDVMAVRFDERLGLRLTENFWTEEFSCRCPKLRQGQDSGFCNGAVRIGPLFDLILPLQRLRNIVGPLVIESGLRCWEYHKWLYKNTTRPITTNSAHLHGLAADVWPKRGVIEETEDNIEMLKRCGFRGVGWRLGEMENKLHLDVMDRGKRPGVLTQWHYA